MDKFVTRTNHLRTESLCYQNQESACVSRAEVNTSDVVEIENNESTSVLLGEDLINLVKRM